ncbi:MAG: sulfatase [Pedobacter agri]
MKILLVAVLAMMIGKYSAQAQQQKTDIKPNIILIVADDLGWKDLGVMGSKYYKTPNLNALAKQGMLFDNSYASAANCAPSRACLLSGLNTPRHGIYTVGSSQRGDTRTRKLIPIKNNNFLADSVITLAETLKEEGYYTCIAGKWHIGIDPLTQGFMQNIGGTKQGHQASYFPPYKNPALADGKSGEYLTDRLTLEAIGVIEQQQKKPFFLYLPYFAVHGPLQAPEHLKEKYRNQPAVDGQGNITYAAMIESLDTNIGLLLAKVEELKLSDNTIIIFTSDNGGIRATSEQNPLRAGKGSYYEGGVRVPLLVKWAKKIKAGAVNNTVVSNLDFYPTILDILKIKRPEQQFDGISIWPALQGSKLPDRAMFWHFPIYLQAYDPKSDQGRDPVFRTRPGSTIRLGNWKLHQYFEDGKLELYNLKDDLGEQHDLSGKYPEVVRQLLEKLSDWRKNVKAPVPSQINPEFEPELQFDVKLTKRGKDDEN